MNSQIRMIRKNALCIAAGIVLAGMASSPLLAQSATGAVAGRATAGDQITITNAATGASRSVIVGAGGSYRISQLPVGNYSLQVTRDGQQVGESLRVGVPLGGTATINLGSEGGVANLDTVQVVGSRVVNRVDVYSTESATNVTREEIARLPVAQDLSSVALLAPSVIGGNSSFGGISFGGSSVAENSVFVNGLNVTDFYRRQSFSTTPFAFYQEFQVKTGGYSVEFGRSTGGVINAVTRSGSNEFESGIEFTFEPNAWRAKADDHEFYGEDSRGQPHQATYRASHDIQNFNKYNIWASGPVVRDRLFLFAMYEQRQNKSGYTSTQAGTDKWNRSGSDNGFWGTKLDWHITDDHLLELLAFSDAGKTLVETVNYDFDTRERSGEPSYATTDSGGKSGSLTYTGYFGDNFVAKAMYGVNRSSSFARSPSDGLCSQVTIHTSYSVAYNALGLPAPGCHPNTVMMVSHEDEREAARLDFEWKIGDHQLRFGLDRELMTTDRTSGYPGPVGTRYTAFARTSDDQRLDNGTLLPEGVDAFVMGRRRIDGGVFETVANAFYIEDNWNIASNLLLNFGIRVDSFDNKTASGSSFIKVDNLLAPRLGFSWDMKGDGSTKLFGNLGRYYLPVTNNINYTFAGGLIDEYTFYELDGWQQLPNPLGAGTYPAPIIGDQIGPVDDDANVSVADLRQTVDRDIDAVYQDELILGFQQAISPAWSWGANATYRRMENALDDIGINHTPCGPVPGDGSDVGTLWVVGNPGEPLTIWGDPSIGCATEGWITIDTSKDGYIKQGSNEVVGYSKPKRTYRSVELQLDRAWDERWAFNASYLWSKSDGNHEGPVNSDTNYGDTGMVQHWDHPANNQDYGPLFNDRRHQIKLRGAYALNHIWSLGASMTAQSGGPIGQLGVSWPGDNRGAASSVTEGSGAGTFWHCVQNCAGDFSERVYRYMPRGSGGRLPWTYNLGASLTWTAPVEGLDLKARLSVHNLLNEQEVINVRQRYEADPGVVRPLHGTGTRWQSPRYTQLVITWNF